MSNYTIGCDPELFIWDGEYKEFVSAHNLVRGTKENPYLIPGGATQVDGVAAEFNIDPCTNVSQWLNNISLVREALENQIDSLSNYADPDQLVLVAWPVARFDPDYFNSLPPLVKVLGCDPDFNAYTGEQNEPPITSEPFRTGAGHVHVGYEYDGDPTLAVQDIHNRVKQLDAVLYMCSPLWDTDTKRRTLYGAPGAFRYKPYGFEYRVLSNAWVAHPSLQRFVFEATMWAMEKYDEGVILYTDSPPTLLSFEETLNYYNSTNMMDDGVPYTFTA